MMIKVDTLSHLLEISYSYQTTPSRVLFIYYHYQLLL